MVSGRNLHGEIEVRAAHEVMATRTAQLALFIDQFMPALQAIPPMFTGHVLARRKRTSCLGTIWRMVVFGMHAV
jgi:hypothetical protein